MRAQLLLAASTLALEKVPLKRQGTTARRRLSVGGRTDLMGVRNPMADDREKGFSDVNLGV